ncbi:6,7-dimethyl-8-ribityllumazine synthase [Gryllotalpicola koreensis]|uniref:6,7-dimethyl-8-ribityllumazine synthase n=1 Tax=Gryllotalpicola koreensis TaxID=993086 RepID=A0ABP7ZST8_9MICO
MTTVLTRVAIVAAQWHHEIVDEAVAEFVDRLTGSGEFTVDVYRVPGAFEIPFHVKRLAARGGYAAIAASALVVDGGIYRHEYVAGAVIDALMRVQLESDVPVFSGVLTPHQFHEHAEHLAYFRRHLRVKGGELADAVTATLASLNTISQEPPA